MNAIFSLGGSILFTFIMKKFGRRSLFIFFEILGLLIPALIVILTHFEIFSVTEWLKILLIMVFQMTVSIILHNGSLYLFLVYYEMDTVFGLFWINKEFLFRYFVTCPEILSQILFKNHAL